MKLRLEIKLIHFEFEKFAKQANGSVMVSCGDTQVLVTACANLDSSNDLGFFPLTVDYLEKFYATGSIPGGYLKRESKPSDRELLTARVIDRPLRPSFPKGYNSETVITATVVSYDGVNHPAPLALVGASAALHVSDIPFNGPIASLRVGMDESQNFIIDPKDDSKSDLDLNIAATSNAILMVEAGANFLSESQMLDAIDYAQKEMKSLLDLQEKARSEIGKEKHKLETSIVKEDDNIQNEVREKYQSEIKQAYSVKDKKERSNALSHLKSKITENIDEEQKGIYLDAFDKVKTELIRSQTISDKIRLDGRKLDQIREIVCETSVLKRTHGSALFTRGETQALGSVTLGAAEDDQRMDTILDPGGSKSFYLHYNFPAFSVGEARGSRGPGRREIGHGALAERALSALFQIKKTLDNTIRVVSEILESNGSSSMASVCAGTLAMLDAGVPIKSPVAGIAMGLIKEGDDYSILSDILGDEDHLGDMDFKVCGSKDGITALQDGYQNHRSS